MAMKIQVVVFWIVAPCSDVLPHHYTASRPTRQRPDHASRRHDLSIVRSYYVFCGKNA